ncbi:MAG: hypothetical protein R3D70_10610 [Rhizobiaceae bacterium]
MARAGRFPSGLFAVATPGYGAVGEVITADVATAASYRAKTAGKVLTADGILAAAAWVTLTDAATVTLGFASFENGYLTVAGNRTLGNRATCEGRSHQEHRGAG